MHEFERLPSDEIVRAFGMKLDQRMVEVRLPKPATLIPVRSKGEGAPRDH